MRTSPGAICGCLLAGFYLLRVFDMATATFVAAAINVAVGLLGLRLAASTPDTPPHVDPESASVPMVGRPSVYVAIALSGLCALAAEVIWTRVLSLMLGATTYTFSIILAVFLAGLGIGSSLGSALARTLRHPRIALGCCQALAGLAIAWTALLLGDSLPFWPVNPWLATSPWFLFQLDIARCAWALLPPAILWGASFPLGLAAAAGPGHEPGRLVGTVYAANTVGAIAGAVLFSVVVVPGLGTEGAQRTLVALSGVAAMAAFFTAGRSATETPASTSARGSAAAACAVLLVAAALDRPGHPSGTDRLRAVAADARRHRHELPLCRRGHERLHRGLRADRRHPQLPRERQGRSLNANRRTCGSSGMLAQRAGAPAPGAEIGPRRRLRRWRDGRLVRAVPRHAAARHLRDRAADPAARRHRTSRRRTSTSCTTRASASYFDDARHRVLTMGETFDIITSDPIHPWVKGAATLYTKEYFEMVRQHLNPGGARHAMGAALREHAGGGEERDRDLLRGVSQRHDLGQPQPGRRLRRRAARPADDGPLDVDGAARRLLAPDHARVMTR